MTRADTVFDTQDVQEIVRISGMREEITVKIRCAVVLISLFMVFLVAGCGNAGSTGEVQDSAADLVVFSDLDAFTAYAVSAEKETDAADLASLRDYFVPTGIPETYQLYKITAGIADIGFWYLPEECLSSTDAILEAESSQKHFLFLSTRGTDELGSVIAQLGAAENELVDDKYLVREGKVIWKQNHTLLMLYLPADYEVDNISFLCTVDQYIRNEEAHIFERVDLH